MLETVFVVPLVHLVSATNEKVWQTNYLLVYLCFYHCVSLRGRFLRLQCYPWCVQLLGGNYVQTTCSLCQRPQLLAWANRCSLNISRLHLPMPFCNVSECSVTYTNLPTAWDRPWNNICRWHQAILRFLCMYDTFQLKVIVLPKMTIIYSPSCHFEPILLSFLCRTQANILKHIGERTMAHSLLLYRHENQSMGTAHDKRVNDERIFLWFFSLMHTLDFVLERINTQWLFLQTVPS